MRLASARGQGGLPVVAHGLHAVLSRLAAEAAVHGDAEVCQVTRRRGVAPQQAGDAVDGQDDAEEDPRVARLEVLKRLEEPVVLAAQVPGPARCSQSTARPELATA